MTKPTIRGLQGALVISLDLELFWGMRHVTTLREYGRNIAGAREALPRMLDLFRKHEIHATHATVGFLMLGSKAALLAASPQLKPTYHRADLSPYANNFSDIGTNQDDDPYHYGASLVRLIQECPGQEIGCHTFSHFFCLEGGQTVDQFEADLEAAVRVARANGIEMTSFVFPSNQYNKDYVARCHKYGIRAYRGNPMHWSQQAGNLRLQALPARRAARFLDNWLPISGHNCHPWPQAQHELPLNIAASHFLRPWSKTTRFLEKARLRRITKAMDHAARTGTIFHLWWHPHNFGINTAENMAFLEKILLHFRHLRKEHGMQSLTMGEVAAKALADG